MFEKVLIAEDHESANISVQKTLDDLGINNKQYAYYCDDALLLLQKALTNNEPFDLLVTDLSFDEDHRPQNIKDGEMLIRAAKAIQPNIKVLVFSAENRPTQIDILFNELGIDAYVRKARRDAEELRKALAEIALNKKYKPATLRQEINKKNTLSFSKFDTTVISLLANGMLQKDIPLYLQKHDIKPSGLSSIEKRLNSMKETLDFTTNQQLIGYCKDLGII